ncbi:hypothetical protein AB9K34_04495 [Sedimentitalea sp. XS_ASV28]|uniref:hypothetical protein n=1 Tax=Sedimentitalea sp. XS_ASV28 TaxID=3241296 RepID=UPI0035187D32
MTNPKPTHVETPGLSYTFYSEDDADMTTPEGRLAWFCAHFEIDAPALAYDPDEPDELLLTDELLGFCGREGLNLDWLFSGYVGGPLAVYREKHRITPDADKWLSCEQRIAQLAEWFEIDAPNIQHDPEEPGVVLATEELLTWLKNEGACMNWVFANDLRTMALTYRKDRIREQEDVKTLTRMDEVEKNLLVLALRARLEQGVPLDQALDAFAVAVKEHRANKAA